MTELFVFSIAVFSSFLGILIPGVSSALGVSSLMLLGIPIQVAKTTYQVGNVGINIGALFPLLRTQKIRKSLIYPLFVISFISGFIGGNILVTIPTNLLIKLTGLFMNGLLFVNIFSKTLGTFSAEVSKKRSLFGFVAYFFLNIFFSVFPMGSGILFQFLHTFFFRVTNLEARLMGCILTIPFVVSFIIPVIQSGVYDIGHMIAFSLGGILGGYIGARLSIKLGNTWIKKALMIYLFFLGIYFLFFFSS